MTLGTAEIPLPWPEKAVVYALTDLDVLRGLANLPGGNPDRVDGVAFPVRAAPGSRKVASTRFMLHPRMISRDAVNATRRGLSSLPGDETFNGPDSRELAQGAGQMILATFG